MVLGTGGAGEPRSRGSPAPPVPNTIGRRLALPLLGKAFLKDPAGLPELLPLLLHLDVIQLQRVA
jgi:hypothetical protein